MKNSNPNPIDRKCEADDINPDRVTLVLGIDTGSASDATMIHNAHAAGNCLRRGVMPDAEPSLDREVMAYSFGRDFADDASARDIEAIRAVVHDANGRLDQQSNTRLKAATSEAWSVLGIALANTEDEQRLSRVVASKAAHEVLMAAGAVRLPFHEFKDAPSVAEREVCVAIELAHRVGDHSQEAGDMLIPAIEHLERARARGLTEEDRGYASEVTRQCKRWLKSSAKSFEDAERGFRHFTPAKSVSELFGPPSDYAEKAAAAGTLA